MKKSNSKKNIDKKHNIHKVTVKKSIDSINEYLVSIKEDFQTDLKTVENDIERVSLLISEAENNKKNIESKFDSSYMVLSSSQVAKMDEFAEIDSFDELINNKYLELKELENNKQIILSKISRLEEVISCAKEIEGSVL